MLFPSCTFLSLFESQWLCQLGFSFGFEMEVLEMSLLCLLNNTFEIAVFSTLSLARQF
jgi:hypothetical protein